MNLSSLAWGAVGGALIGLSASLFLLTHGKVAGISGMVSGLFEPKAPDRSDYAWFLAGLLFVGVALAIVKPEMLAAASPSSLGLTAVAGLLVGFGTSLGSGCTSGHGICGVSRLSPRSLVATATFLVTGMITVFVARHLLGGGS
jgi:uncharacterized membrane protein YedE/YeeE